ncbi:hypothetical protein PENTCL1PPCAC_27712, partial [Pristionchus entomophagus]
LTSLDLREKLGLDLQLLGLFPRERLVAEVAVASSLLEDRALESEILQDESGSEVEVLVDNAEQLELAQWRGVVRDDGDGEGLGHADGVRHLDEAAEADACLHQRLGHPTGTVRRRSIHLISSSNIFLVLSDVDTASDLGRLLLECNKHIARLVVEALAGIVESDLLDGVYDETLVVDDSLARDFSRQENHSSLGYSFSSDLGVRVLGEVRVENRVGDDVAHLVGVPLRHGLSAPLLSRTMAHLRLPEFGFFG